MMKALVFQQSLKMVELDAPKPKDDEALIRVRMAGICNTDLEILKGYMNFHGIPGHEFVGEVVESKDTNWIGNRVVGEINIACGQCDLCRSDLARHCTNRSVLGIQGKNGVFCEYITLPLRNLHKIPEIVKDEEAVFVEPLAAAYEILEQVHIGPDSRVAVVGDGKLGQLIAGVLRFTGCRLTVIGKHQNKLNILKNLGIETWFEKKVTHRLFDIVVEASGSPHGFKMAQYLLKPRGILVLKSTTYNDIQLNLASIVVNEMSVVGSRCGKFEPGLRLLENRMIDVLPFVSSVYPLTQWQDAFQMAQNSESIKVLLQIAV